MSNMLAIPSQSEFHTMKEMGQMAIKSGFLPSSIKTPEQAVVIILKGRELGMKPMQAFASIAVINGKPTISAEGMISLIYKNVQGAVIDFVKTDNAECEISAKRPGGKKTKFSFTMDDAKRANLTGKGPWVTYPAAMLRARCISAMARALFADALSGVVYTPEELGADIDDDGNIIEETPAIVAPQINPLKEARAASSASTDDPANYLATFGKFKGKKLSDIEFLELDDYVKFIADEAHKKGKEITGKVAEFMTAATLYINMTVDSQPQPEYQDFDDKNV